MLGTWFFGAMVKKFIAPRATISKPSDVILSNLLFIHLKATHVSQPKD